MKSLLSLALLLLLCAQPALAAKTKENPIITSGNQYITSTMTKVLASYQGVHYNITYVDPNSSTGWPGFWDKISGLVEPNYKVNVHQTASLPLPSYAATLEVTYDTSFYQPSATKEEAAASDKLAQTTSTIYQFTLAYQNKQWVVTDSKKFDSQLNQWFATSTTDILTELSCKYDPH